MRHLGTDDYEQVARRLGVDIRKLNPRPASDRDKSAALARFVESVRRATTVSELRALRWPTWDMLWDFRWLKQDLEQILSLDQEYAIQIPGPSIWEVARTWRGFDRIMIDWATNPEFVTTLFEIVYSLYMPIVDQYAHVLGDAVALVDYVYAGSDLGMQDRPMVSPELIERDYEPLIRREVRRFKEVFPNLFFEFHCCGSIRQLLPFLDRAGVDVLHPVQPGCAGNDFDDLKRSWGHRFAFRGGVDGQGVMAFGSQTDVRAWALHVFRTLGCNGGCIISPHGIMPEVPPENVLALFDTVQRECWY